MNPFEMVVLIVIVVTIGRVLSHRRGGFRQADRDNRDERIADPAPPAETARLKDEVAQLKQRIQVLERIAVDKENSIAREIEQLRDR